MTTLTSLLNSQILSFIKFRKCTLRNNLDTTQASCLYDRGHETLEMLDRMLFSLDQAEQHQARESKGKHSCMLLNEMLDSFDQGLKKEKRKNRKLKQ